MGQYLDTRDLYKRQCELQEELDALVEAVEEAPEMHLRLDTEESEELHREARDDHAKWVDEYQEELDELNRLENEVGDEWLHGCTLIPEDDFKDYAMDLAEDIHGAAIKNADWPFSCIDWQQAADDLQADYSSVDYEGETYWFRS